jgi:alkyl hydroperoxide reductase 1
MIIVGPFTPACSETHVPGFLNAHDSLKAKGVSEVLCISCLDGFVMVRDLGK